MAFTLSTYTHRSTGQDREAAESFAVLLFGGDREGTAEDSAAS